MTFNPVRAVALLALILPLQVASAATFTINDPSCAGFVLSGAPPNQVISCQVNTPPPPPPPSGGVPPPPVAAGSFNDNQRLWVAAAMGRPDNELIARLGIAAYTNGVQDRSVGGRIYDPQILSQATMAAGGNLPPQFAWAGYVAQGKGSIVNGVFVWSPSAYPLFLALR